MLYGLTDVPELITFDIADPATVDSVPITGVADGSTLLAIDVRTSDRSVLGVSDASVLYSIDPQTGVATAIGDGINPPLGDPGVGMNRDEGTNRVRLSSAIGDNLLVDPATGTVEVDPATERPVVDSSYDRIESAGPRVVALAGSGSGGGAPVLYGIDSVEAKLVKVDSPADGVVQTVGPLGITVTDGASFDIGPDGEALLVVPG